MYVWKHSFIHIRLKRKNEKADLEK